ncbi:Periplasmic chaperone and peptidyl-prolyl cis-trans isomerase of outer membrane proteins SurA [hydrothermal vent metagenome]|uniref:Periplasmic chaperone PpiD n=1 Tax=hydrothermal vent metagenome TaxID=652676 RepID=A0A3B0R3E9_9ZZZZ
MLEVFRSKRNSFFVIVIFAVIILGFVFFGVAPSSKQGGDEGSQVVARVNGSEITSGEYSNIYKRQLDYYKNIFKDGLNDEMLAQLNLREKALEALIERRLVLQEANSRKFKASREDIQARVMKYPVFQKDGVFDKETYFAVLQQNRIKPAEFEESIGAEILIGKMQQSAVAGVTLSDDEAKAAFDKENKQIKFEYAMVTPASFEDKVKVSAEKGRAFLKDNGALFMTPTRVKAFYAYVDKDQFAAEVKISEDELRAFYEKRKATYSTPKEVRASHILIRPDKSIEDKDKARAVARKTAEVVLAKIKKGAGFSKLASEYSDDPGSAVKGGDLGFFGQGMMVKPFEDAAFTLAAGEVSGVVETDYGYHIIKVMNIKGGGTPTFKDLRNEIKKQITVRRSEETARARMVELHKAFKAEGATFKTIKKAAKERGIKTNQTPFFTESDVKIELVRAEKLRDTAFSLPVNGVSGIIYMPKRFYIIKIAERVDSHVPPYEKVAKKVASMLKREEALAMASKKAEELRKDAASGKNFKRLMRKAGFKVESTDYVSLSSGFIPGIGIFVGDRTDLFEMDKGDIYKEAIEHGRNFYLLRAAKVKAADFSGFEQGRMELHQRLLDKKRQDTYAAWVKELRSKALIEINEELL